MFKVYCIIGLYNSVLYNSVLIGLPDPLLEPMEEVGTEGRGEEREGGADWYVCPTTSSTGCLRTSIRYYIIYILCAYVLNFRYLLFRVDDGIIL